FRSDISSELAATGNYTAGGNSLASKAKTYDSATNEEQLTANNLTWTALTPSSAFRYGIIYKSRGGAASADELLAYIDFGADQNTSGADFQIQWAATGVLFLQAA